MAVVPNGTDAKDIALYFIDITSTRTTPAIVAKTIIQAKELLKHNYTKEEIISVIDYLIDVKKVNIYSLGYISSSINDTLREINEIKKREIALKQIQETKEKLAIAFESTRNEVSDNSKTGERNREKASRTSFQSRLGEKFNFDMFEKS